MNACYQLARADFLERVRRPRFLVIVGIAVFVGFNFASGAVILHWDDYRGINTAAWLGTMIALVLSIPLYLLGFYIVRGNIEQDRRTGVGQILAATPLRTFTFALGKFASNVAVLLVLIAVIMIAALITFLVHGEDKTLNMTFLVLCVPVAMIAASVAVLFECTPMLSRGGGNVLYFILWLVTIDVIGVRLMGYDLVERTVLPIVRSTFGEYEGGTGMGVTVGGYFSDFITFYWPGVNWLEIAASRLLYTIAALMLVLIAATVFERFDPARRLLSTRRESRMSHWWRSLNAPLTIRVNRQLRGAVVNSVTQMTAAPISEHATAMFGQILWAEFKLLVKGRLLLWYAGALALMVACLLSPVDAVRAWILPLTWLWPLLIWSEMGVRELQSRTDQILFSSPAPARRQLPATWTAGVLLALVMGSGALVRFFSAPEYLPGVVSGMLFIPSLALACGVISGTGRLFQITLLVLWYAGPLNGMIGFDYSGSHDSTLAAGMPLRYAGLSLMLLATAYVMRRSQIRHGHGFR